MSEENVERLRQAVEALNRGDRTTFLALCDPEVENIPPRDWPESEPIRGREAYWQVYRLRDGRAVRIEVYKDQLEALKAGGLE